MASAPGIQQAMRHRAALFSLLLGVMVGTTSPALGTIAAHFPNTNSSDDGYEIDSARPPPFDNSNFVNRFHNAASEWSGIAGSGLDFISDGQRSMPQTLTAGSVTADETWVMDYWNNDSIWNWPSCSPCAMGTAQITFLSGNINRVLIRINEDNDIPWHQGGNPGPTQYDLLSTMTHEIGHAAGGKGNPDFGSGSAECNNLYTMCGVSSPGSTYKQTVSSHEIADMAAKY